MQTKLTLVVKNNQKFGLIDADTNVLLECTYDNVWYWHELDYVVYDCAGKLLFVGAEGSPVDIGDKKQPLFLNSFTHRCGIYQNGVIVSIDPVFDFILPFAEGVAIAARRDGKKSLIDIDGGIVGTSKSYDAIGTPINGFAIVERQGWKGLINEKGEMVLPTEYDDLKYPTSAGYVTVFKNQKAGLVTTQNRIVFESEYDRIVKVEDHIYALGSGDKTEIVNLSDASKQSIDLQLVSKL